MRILLINKFYYPKGGAERIFFLLKRMLEAAGHTVIVFAMQDERNLPTPYSRYFVSHVDFERVRFDWQGLRAAGRMLYSFEARRKIRELIRAEKPDVAHVFNIYHQISPSILPELKKNGVPVVQTLFDAKLLSPNYTLYAHGGICEHGRGFRYYECILHRCIKDSFVASTIAAVEMYVHKLLQIYERNVDAWIVPSKFLLKKRHEWRVRIRNVHLVPNCIELPAPEPVTVGHDILFIGRLSDEKGVMDLIEAAKGVPYPVTIIGTGPQEHEARARAAALGLTNVSFLGFLGDDELTRRIRGARFVVVPSRCYENGPLTILEAFAHGKPVIAPNLGSMPELVRPGDNGTLYKPGSVDDLRRAMLELASDPARLARYGENALWYAQQFSANVYFDSMMRIYEDVAAHR